MRQISRKLTNRLPEFDYRLAGAYFVTVLSFRRMPIFGKNTGIGIELSDIGSMVLWHWDNLSRHFNISVDWRVVMADHFHGILWIKTNDNMGSEIGPQGVDGTKPGSLSAIIQCFKAVTSRRYHQMTSNRFPLWQRGFYDRIFRNGRELSLISEYIQSNPERLFLEK